jgi:hypothetical protein
MDQELLTLHNQQRSSRFLVGIHVAQSSVFSIVVYTSWSCTRLAAASDKVYQLLAHDQWFFPGTPASSTTKTGHHDIAEILLKVTLNTINQSINQSYASWLSSRPSFAWSLICLSLFESRLLISLLVSSKIS